MPTIGTIPVNLFTVDRDATSYARAANTVSHTDRIDLKRTLPTSPVKPLRTVVRFERGFPVANPGENPSGEFPVTVSIAVTVPPGVVDADVVTFVTEALTESAAAAANIAITGDIHLGA